MIGMYSQESGDHINNSAFCRAIESPECIHETNTGIDYRVYRFNEQQPGKPVVVKLGLGSTALNKSGQLYLKTFATEIPRPLVLLEPDRQLPSIERSADADRRIIDRLEIEEMDFMGMSRGALLAAGLAYAMQERAGHLLTISGVTREGIRSYTAGAIGVLMESMREKELPGPAPMCIHDLLHPNDSHIAGNMRKIRRLGAGIMLVLAPSFQLIPERLAATTRWTDLVGEHDNFTSTIIHEEAIARRNSIEPGTATLGIADNIGHLWTRHREWLGRTAAKILTNDGFALPGRFIADDLMSVTAVVPVLGPSTQAFPGLAQTA